ncbi:MAG: tRNA pseudouridine(55) synthase TruB [Ruminococcaceae bacterium]|nr:tRNA pseudouridine(55) synthase TruB [Oscillospiraceae bacterium]
MPPKAEGAGPAGILVVDKPAGFTSFDVVAKLRGICGTRKIGHGGTLDPMATGVLPVFVGAAAKAVDLAPRQDKTYEATLLFGLATDTGDITGAALEQADVTVTEAMLAAALPAFVGPQEQLPPMYSAVKIDGKPLYKYAREGKTIERKPRPVTIFSLDYLGTDGENRFRLRAHCSKGTYMRTLAEDIGKALGVPATLAALRRTAAGVFTLEQAHTLQAIQQAKDTGALAGLYQPIGRLFDDWPRLEVDDTALHRLLNGAAVRGVQAEPGRYALYAGQAFAGLGRVAQPGTLQAEKMFYPEIRPK